MNRWEPVLSRRLARRNVLIAFGAAGASAVLVACGKNASGRSSGDANASDSSNSRGASGGGGEQAVSRPDGWTDATHGPEADPDFATVFPADRVPRMTIWVTPENWTRMLDNMTELFGERGMGGISGGGIPDGGFQLPPAADGGAVPQPADGGVPPVPDNGGRFPGGGAPGGGPGFGSTENPMWVPATIEAHGHTWTNVGFRFKGNSSLRSAWSSGTDRIPFKLDFDEFEGDHPEIADQRFFGFRQLSLGNNFSDASYMRETLASRFLAASGLVAAKTAPYEIVLDHGEGETSLGLYTVLEVVDDTVIDRSFADASGNIYEADGQAASFAAGTDAQIEASFEAEGGDNANWTDVKALYATIHDARRTSDPDAWRRGLEAVFDVPVFLEWLALAATLQHWDAYGGMTHNYYLYNNPDTRKLTWISWDHNQVLAGSGSGIAGGPRPGGRPGAMGSTSFDKSAVTDQWPLIRFVLDQPAYAARYREALTRMAEEVFLPAKWESEVTTLAALLRPFTGDSAEFDKAGDSLVATIHSQARALESYLAS